MIDNPFRERLARHAGPFVRLYGALGLTPNAVSVLGFGLALLAAGRVVAEQPLAALAIWWLGRLVDGTDGIYARATGQSSGFGAYIDIVLDMGAYGVMILAFSHLHPEQQRSWLAILFLYTLCVASALALGAQEEVQQTRRRDDRGLRLGAGLAEGGETGIAYTLFLLFPGQIAWLTGVWIVVLGTTVIARTLLARRLLAGGDPSARP